MHRTCMHPLHDLRSSSQPESNIPHQEFSTRFHYVRRLPEDALENFRQPFFKGWKRKLVIQKDVKNPVRKIGHVYYYTPHKEMIRQTWNWTLPFFIFLPFLHPSHDLHHSFPLHPWLFSWETSHEKSVDKIFYFNFLRLRVSSVAFTSVHYYCSETDYQKI